MGIQYANGLLKNLNPSLQSFPDTPIQFPLGTIDHDLRRIRAPPEDDCHDVMVVSDPDVFALSTRKYSGPSAGCIPHLH
jgi:hypothetical protein